MTTVINIRGRDREALLRDPSFVYVGRPVYRGSLNWKGSPWANPFKVGVSRRAAIDILGRDIDRTVRADHLDGALAVAFYRAWIVDQPVFTRLGDLRGKMLGCWCAAWSPGQAVARPCHAIALAIMVDRIDSSDAAFPRTLLGRAGPIAGQMELFP